MTSLIRRPADAVEVAEHPFLWTGEALDEARTVLTRASRRGPRIPAVLFGLARLQEAVASRAPHEGQP